MIVINLSVVAGAGPMSLLGVVAGVLISLALGTRPHGGAGMPEGARPGGDAPAAIAADVTAGATTMSYHAIPARAGNHVVFDDPGTPGPDLMTATED